MRKPVSHTSFPYPTLQAAPFVDADRIRLTERQRTELTRIALRVRLPARAMVYDEGDPADSVFILMEGMVKSFRELRSGKRVVCAFLSARDVFGLAEKGRYVNSAQAVTAVTFYRLPVQDLAVLLQHDGELQLKFLAKVTHELREAQRRSILVNRRDAVGRLAMFLSMMRRRGEAIDEGTADVSLPMSRADIAAFVGLSPEALSRAVAELERRELVTFEGRHVARILDPGRLGRLAAAA